MTYGFRTWKADGTPMLTLDGSGGVYIGFIQHDPNAGGSNQYVFTNIGDLQLRVVQANGNRNYWRLGTVGGYPAIIIEEYESTTHYDYGGTLDLWVFGV
jgi:hypothetical protein